MAHEGTVKGWTPQGVVLGWSPPQRRRPSEVAPASAAGCTEVTVARTVGERDTALPEAGVS